MTFLQKHHGQMSDSMLTAFFIILSGGLQDAYTYCCRGKVFANAQTGNIVLLSTHLFEGDWGQVLRYLVPVLAFLLGIYIAECVHRRFKRMEKVHWRQLIILTEIVLLAAVVFGPGAGFAVGAVADIIGGVLAGYAINPLITLGAGAIGLVAGLAWQKLPGLRTGLRLQISVLLGHFVGSMVITSLALRIFYGYPWATLAVRIPNALILAAVNTVLLRILLENRTLMKMVKK